MPRLTGADVESAFVETAASQVNGEPFDWEGVADRINRRLSGPPVHRTVPEKRALLAQGDR